MGDGAWHSDAPRTIARCTAPAPTYFTVAWTSPDIQQLWLCQLLRSGIALCSVATSTTASTVELCCEEPRLDSHSIQPLLQWHGACLSGSLAACGPTRAISPDLRSPPLLFLGYAACLLRDRRSAV